MTGCIDEPALQERLAYNLTHQGYTVEIVSDGNAALEVARSFQPDLILLDVMLPGLDGWEVCKRLRAESNVPILMLTARDDDIDKIVGLELGADDYMTKPFNPRELVARVKAILRRLEPRSTNRNMPQGNQKMHVGNITIDPASRTVTVGDRLADLRTKEFDLLVALVENKGIVLSREKLLDLVWGFDFYGETRTVDVHVAHLRHKLDGSSATIETVWGIGYKLVEP